MRAYTHRGERLWSEEADMAAVGGGHDNHVDVEVDAIINLKPGRCWAFPTSQVRIYERINVRTSFEKLDFRWWRAGKSTSLN